MNSHSPLPGHQETAHHFQKFWANKFTWWKNASSRLSIGTKIRCGYALALGIAVLGTTVGIGIGNYYEESFREEAEKWHETGVLFNDLQLAVLQARSHQQKFAALLGKPQDFQNENLHFLQLIGKVKSLLKETKNSVKAQEIAGVKQFFLTYEQVVEDFLNETEIAFDKINESTLSQKEKSELQNLLLNLSISESALKFDDYSAKLSAIAKKAFQEETKAENNVEKGEVLQVSITMSSMLISAIIAIFLALYTTRAIERPLKATTEVAQKVTQEDNFDLQAPVTTSDEVGVKCISKSTD